MSKGGKAIDLVALLVFDGLAIHDPVARTKRRDRSAIVLHRYAKLGQE